MNRGKTALLVPADGVDLRRLEAELLQDEVEVLGKDGGLIFVRWDENSIGAIPQKKNVRAYYTDEISETEFEQLTPSAVRLAKIWNWSIASANRGTTDEDMTRLWRDLKIEVREDESFDLIDEKGMGKIQRGEKTYSVGNWTLTQSKSWQLVPGGPAGNWVKFQCISSTTPNVADLIIAQVYGPKHFANTSKNNTTAVVAYDWSWIWLWESWSGTIGFSQAIIDGTIKTKSGNFYIKLW